ncbi:MAG: glycosyltransferase [Verrucomicrobiota bacterium]
MIYFDVTKTGRAGHASGLNRVSARLRDELGADIVPVEWHGWRKAWRTADGRVPVEWRADDWLLTGELFSEAERPGFGNFLQARRCRTAAVYYDAIPLKFPHITWPQSVARHPHYLGMLAEFDQVLAISQASAGELREFWRWQGRMSRAVVTPFGLGADFSRRERVTASGVSPAPAGSLLCVGILEPRKNQSFLLDVCETLWHDGLQFDLHLVGRVNPHFGRPVVARAKALRKAGRTVTHHEGVDDTALRRLYATARATVFPTLAEGCGLPVIESLWQGVPCVCSDLPVLRENTDGGGCLPVTVNDSAAWAGALRRVLTDDAFWQGLVAEAVRRPLPTWAASARQLRAALSA